MRSTLVVVGLTVCLFGTARLAPSGARRSAVPTLAGSGTIALVDHAIAERPITPTQRAATALLASGGAVLIAGAVLGWALSISSGRDLTFARLGMRWRRRGPPQIQLT